MNSFNELEDMNYSHMNLYRTRAHLIRETPQAINKNKTEQIQFTAGPKSVGGISRLRDISKISYV